MSAYESINPTQQQGTARSDTLLDMPAHNETKMMSGNHHSGGANHGLTFTNEQFEQMMLRIAGPAPAPVPLSGLGNPGPLGLASFAMTTFVLSCFNTGVLISSGLEGVVLPLALFYGGISQFAAGMWEYKANNTFGATAFTSYGAFWMSFAAYVYFIVPGFATAGRSDIAHATGLYLLGWTIFTVYMTVAAFRVSKVVFGVFAFLSMTFLLLTIGELANSTGCTHAGGWFGLATAAIAWYGSAAVVTNSTWGRVVMPIGAYVPVNHAKSAELRV
ncbi:hypothetical protein HKX48_003941 [Thoreauomyces humboldtii]|nr:hypothetical protein HKX48_003941 [Thoreauomyces humboldtii]